MSNASRRNRALRIAAEVRKEDSRIETLLALGKRARPYAGETPADAHPKYQKPYTMGEHQSRVRLGRVESRGGTRTFVPVPPGGRDPVQRAEPRSYGGPIGDALVADKQPSLLAAGTQSPEWRSQDGGAE